MTRVAQLVLLAAFAASGIRTADAADMPRETSTILRLSTTTEHLGNDTPDWRENSLGATFAFKPRHALDIAAGEISRFGLHDNQVAAAYTAPLSATLTATVDGNFSTTHHVLARHALGAELQYEVAPAWLLHGGVRSSNYDAASVNQAVFMLEHYFSSFSWTLGWRPTRAFGTTANSAELRGAYYYGDRSAVTLIAAAGKEAASVPGGVALSSVRSIALSGRHWLDRRWAVTYGMSHVRQGGLYSRNGINVGIQFAF